MASNLNLVLIVFNGFINKQFFPNVRLLQPISDCYRKIIILKCNLFRSITPITVVNHNTDVDILYVFKENDIYF